MPDAPKKRKRIKATTAQIAEALQVSNGLITVAASRLGVDYQALKKRVDRSETLRSVMEDAREKMLDLAENQLFTLVANKNWKAIRYILDTFGQKRGYGLREEQADKTTVNVNLAPSLPMERLEQIIDNYRHERVIEIEDAKQDPKPSPERPGLPPPADAGD